MVRRGEPDPAGSSWGRLADRRARELLASCHADRALIVRPTGGFSYGPSVDPGTTLVSCLKGGWWEPLRGLPTEIPVASGTFTSVIDSTRPEQPTDHERVIRELIRVCRPGGRIGLIACGGGTGGGSRRLAPRPLEKVVAWLGQAGCDIEKTVSFDIFAPLSSWRLMLGERCVEVLGELEEHLRSIRVRNAVRLLERHLVAALPPCHAGRVFVVARRRQGGQGPAAVIQERPHRDLAALIEDEAFGGVVLRFLQDDAVLRWAAFLDAEIISAVPLPFNLVAYVEEMSSRTRNAAMAVKSLSRRRRWRYPGFEVQAVVAAATYRMTKRTIAALRDAPESVYGTVRLPETLEYELFGALGTEIMRPPVNGPPPCRDL